MTMSHHYTFENVSQLTDALNAHAEAGIDPAFDFEMEELERQFDELRFALNHN